MEIALMTGAYKNSGDYLIENRCRRLIEHSVKGSIVHRFLRSEMANRVSEINNMDAIVFTGGPIYMSNIENIIPIVDLIDDIKIPMMIVGGGWYGSGNAACLPYKQKFSDFSVKFLSKVENEGFGLACRDLYTVKMLKNAGFEKVYMTGCPAWYNLETIGLSEVKNSGEINKIIISDPADPRNMKLAKHILEYVLKRYQGSRISLAIHRGITKSHSELCNYSKANGVEVLDLSGSESGFSVYDDCSLHIGFRVHAHIYNLSLRNRTILIEEDGRGAGVNEALGIPSILAYDDSLNLTNRSIDRIKGKLGLAENHNALKDLGIILDMCEETDWQYLSNAFLMMQKYYNNMHKYVFKLNDLV